MLAVDALVGGANRLVDENSAVISSLGIQ